MPRLRTVAQAREVLIAVQCLGEGSEPQPRRRSGVGGLDGTGLGTVAWNGGQDRQV